MKMIKDQIKKLSVQKLAVCLVLGGVMASAIAMPAHADPRGHVDHDWHRHEERGHAYWHGGHYEPAAVYAPPVVYAPPPQPESTGINLVLPIHFH